MTGAQGSGRPTVFGESDHRLSESYLQVKIPGKEDPIMERERLQATYVGGPTALVRMVRFPPVD